MTLFFRLNLDPPSVMYHNHSFTHLNPKYLIYLSPLFFSFLHLILLAHFFFLFEYSFLHSQPFFIFPPIFLLYFPFCSFFIFHFSFSFPPTIPPMLEASTRCHRRWEITNSCDVDAPCQPWHHKFSIIVILLPSLSLSLSSILHFCIYLHTHFFSPCITTPMLPLHATLFHPWMLEVKVIFLWSL